MPSVSPARRQKIIEALEVSDARKREKRADRMVWMSEHNQRPSILMGTPEELGLLGEAEDAFREGHFISVILLALALVEHDLSEALIVRSLAKYGVSLMDAVELGRQHKILDEHLLDQIDRLRLIRNPFTHLKKPDHEHTFGNRYIADGIHPMTLLEDDAKRAFQTMFDVFRALLRAESPSTGSARAGDLGPG